MVKRLLNKKGMILGIAFISALLGVFALCTKDNPVQVAIDDTWTITGHVQNGYTGEKLDSAVIMFANRDGDKEIVTADINTGFFVCKRLPYGSVTLTVQYTNGETPFTTAVLSIYSGTEDEALSDSARGKYKFRDTSIVVELFPTVGSVSGTVQAQKHERAAVVAAESAQVAITFDDPAMVYASPRTFIGFTDATGKFKIDSLPLAGEPKVAVLSAKSGGIEFAKKEVTISDLVTGNLQVGTIVLDVPLSETNPSTSFRLLYSSFPTKIVKPNETLEWVFSGAPDSVASFATIQNITTLSKKAATGSVTASVKSNSFKVASDMNLVDTNRYVVSINVYGAKGGSVMLQDTFRVAAANMGAVLSSNVLTATKEGISGLGLTDTMTFVFAQDIEEATASVLHGSTVELVNVSVDDATLTIAPKGKWLAGEDYEVKVNATLADGTPVSFMITVTTEGALAFIESNVFKPSSPTTGKNGFIVTDPIVIRTNKALSSVAAILTREGMLYTTVQVPVTASVSGDTATIVPQSVLKFGTEYTLKLTVTSTDGEVISSETDFTTTASDFYLLSSNVCVGGDATVAVKEFNPAAVMVVVMSDTVVKATATLTTVSGTPVPTEIAYSADSIYIAPSVPPLSAATLYRLSVSAENKKKVTAAIVIDSFKTGTALFCEWSNVRIGNDPDAPVINFDPLDNIVIAMSGKLAKATAQVIDNTNALVKSNVSIKGEGRDTIVIDPEEALSINRSYKIIVYAEDDNGNKYVADLTHYFVYGLTPVRGVYIVASNVMTADQEMLRNLPLNTVPWFKMSVAPVAASIRVDLSGTSSGTIEKTVTVSGDTLFITPAKSFKYDETVYVDFRGVAVNGKYINESKQFVTEKAKIIHVISTNVTNANGEGLTNVSVSGNIKVLLSSTPVEKSVIKTDNVGAMGNAQITVSGDTIIINPVTNLDYGTSYSFDLDGQDADGNSFNVTVPASSNFTTEKNVFVVASNLTNDNGTPKITFSRYGEMWIKFSEPLSTDINDYVWAAYNSAQAFIKSPLSSGGTQIIGEGDAAAPNAAITISGDTLKIMPDKRVAIGFDAKVSFNVTIKTTTGKTATFGAAVQTLPLNLFVKTTNTLDSNGIVREDFGAFDEVWVVSSVPIDTILGVNSPATPAAGGVAVVDGGALRSRVRLSANGDTIFYVPAAKLASGIKYSLDFNVRLVDEPLGTVHSNVLDMAWQVKSGVAITAMNVMTNGSTFRPFKVIGDSLVVTFSKAIDTSATAPTAFTVNGLGGLATTRTWSNGLRTVTIKNIDTLAGRPYSIAANDYTTNNTTYDYTIDFDVTCTDGEEQSGLDGENAYVGVLAIKTEQELALIGSNMIPSHVTSAAIAVGETPTDEFAVDGNVTLVFNRAIDTNMIKADAGNLYRNFIQLLENGTTLPLTFALSFSNSGRTVTINPAMDLDYATDYDVLISDIRAIGLSSADDISGNGTDVTNSILNVAEFTTEDAPPIDISALRVTDLGIDTVKTTTGDKRFGYSPAGGGYAGGSYKGASALTVRFTELAWNANHDDSISEYQVQVQKAGSPAWINCPAIADQGFSNFNSDLRNRNSLSINLTALAAASYNALKTPQRTPSVDWANGDQVFNYGDSIAVRIRPIIGSGATPIQQGLWSNVIYFKDNVAPVDSTMCTNFINAALGGVTISATNGTPSAVDGVILGLRDGVSATSLARVPGTPGLFNGYADNSYFIMDLTFPEDMDIAGATKPSLAVYYGSGSVPGSGSNITANSTESKWISSRVYRLVLTIPAVNYTGNDVYTVLSVVGVNDASGVAIQNHGSIGTGATGANNGNLSTAIDAVRGTRNLWWTGALEVGAMW